MAIKHKRKGVPPVVLARAEKALDLPVGQAYFSADEFFAYAKKVQRRNSLRTKGG